MPPWHQFDSEMGHSSKLTSFPNLPTIDPARRPAT